jgi:hypothetical protein
LSAGDGATSYSELKAMLSNLDRGTIAPSDSMEYEMHLNGILKSLREFRYIMDPDRKVHADDDKSALLRAQDASRWVGATNVRGPHVVVYQSVAPTAATDLAQFGAQLSHCYIRDNALDIAINEYLTEAAVARTTGTPATDVLGWANRVANATLLTENTAGTAFRGFAGVEEGRKIAGFWVLDGSAAGATSINAQNIFSVRRPSSDSRSAILSFKFPTSYTARLSGCAYVVEPLTKNTAQVTRTYQDARDGQLNVRIGYINAAGANVWLCEQQVFGADLADLGSITVEVPLIAQETVITMSIGHVSAAAGDVPMVVSCDGFIANGSAGYEILKDGSMAAGSLGDHAGYFRNDVIKSLIPHMSTIKDVLAIARAADSYYGNDSISASLQVLIQNANSDRDWETET